VLIGRGRKDKTSAGLCERLARLEAVGARLDVTDSDGQTHRVGDGPPRARVQLRTAPARDALLAGDSLGLAEAYLRGDVEVEGELVEALEVTRTLELRSGRARRLARALRLLATPWRRRDRAALSAHYDHPVGFFLPWLGRWRCYSHGLYARGDEPLDAAIERKLAAAWDALGLEPGMRVLDVGGGWGAFVEYAGLRGARVHAVTLSREQHRFVEALIAKEGLPCTSELVHFRDLAPGRRFDAAVFMGSFEHNPGYERVVARLGDLLAPRARVWADFCAQRTDFAFGAFMARYIWPGPTSYVDPSGLARAFQRGGWNLHALRDDTRSYARTVRDWAERFESAQPALEAEFPRERVRAFRLYLRGSELFLARNRTQAYHLVAGPDAAALGGAS
jgi:cyclopropane-fatty-acyl-phospholipid synthase